MTRIWVSLCFLACNPSPWQVVGEELAEAALAVTSADGVVWVVGGDVGAGPLLLRLEESWQRIDVGSTGDLWWVWAAPGGHVWAVGAEGRAVRLDAEGQVLDTEILDPSVTLFGVWGASEREIWAVGGDLSSPERGPVVFHFAEGAWREVELAEELTAFPLAFKVWGTAADDVWLVGAGGLIAHYGGERWRLVESGTTRTLFTVHGTSRDQVYAVGGFGSGTLLAYDGESWADASPAGAPTLSGVFATDQEVWAVGSQGGVVSGQPGAWGEVTRHLFTTHDLHAVHVDHAGRVWGAGGAIASAPLERGVIGARGEPAPPPL